MISNKSSDKSHYLKTTPSILFFDIIKALRVHVSPECFALLNELGGFDLVERGPVTMKVREIF